MLRRQKQIRAQLQKLLDGCLFALALYLSWFVRQHYLKISWFGGYPDIENFEDFVWLGWLMVPVAPLLLDVQGFYKRPLLARRRTTAWHLFKASFVATLVLIFLVFLFKQNLARSVIFLFGPLAFLI